MIAKLVVDFLSSDGRGDSGRMFRNETTEVPSVIYQGLRLGKHAEQSLVLLLRIAYYSGLRHSDFYRRNHSRQASKQQRIHA